MSIGFADIIGMEREWRLIRALPIFSRVDIPVLAAQLTAGSEVQPVLTYEVGKRASWLWPGDLLHFLAAVKRGSWPKGFFNFFDSNTCYDVLSMKNPIPSVMFLIGCLNKMVKGR